MFDIDDNIFEISSELDSSGKKTFPVIVNYAASKAGMLILNKIFAQALAPYSITVNAISPAAIDSPITKEVMDENKIQEVTQKIPLKRMGTMQEVAAAVSYLTSDNENFITGSVLDINGGLYMR